MSKELVIGSNRHETKVAVLEEDALVEVYFQRANEYSLAGSIHKGKVTRVLPGMQSAFVDLGLERDTFLYVSDFFEENEDIDTVVEDKPVRAERGDRGGDRRERDSRPVRQALPPTYIPSAAQETVEPRIHSLPVAGEEDVFEEEGDFAAESNIGSLPGEQRASDLGSSEAKAVEVRANEGRGAEPPAREAGGEARGGENFRGSDRRGRRSRRRRSRGHGFPDNKYAQPGDERPAQAEAAGVSEPSVKSEEVSLGAPEPIILPGESLAKYRRLATTPEAEHSMNLDREEDAYPEPVLKETGDEEQPLSTDELRDDEPAREEALEQEAIQQEIEEEALSLELTERILSHADEYVDEGEERYAEERQDQPSSPFVVGDIETEEAVEHDAPVAQPLATNVQVSLPQPSESETEHHAHTVSGEQAQAEAAALFLEQHQFAAESEALADVDDESSDAEGEFDAEGAEPGEIETEIAAAPGVSTEGEEPGPQTASVREQGGRYMHRVSRRMRRRRGGNRSGQPGQQQAGSAELAVESVSGAAPALQSDQRAIAPVEERLRERVDRPERSDRSERPERAERPERVLPSISELLKPGQEIIVQIAKEPLGQKGARITSHIALPGRFVVFMPSVNHLGVSRKIASDEERQRLKRILQAHRVGTVGGFIVRTAGEGVPEDEIAADMDFLYKLWLDIRQKAEKKPAPALLHYDLDVVQRILRDQVTEDFKAIWVDNEDMYENVLSFMQRFQPALVTRVKMYTRSAPIFDAFGITQELEKALRPKVWLKSGGYIVINQTEALVAIDINTGKYVGKSNRLEDTIVKTNTEAVKEIVRQIRLRDLGGIIVVDFIDMDERKNRQKVMQALEEAMRADKAPYKILQFNDFGLVAITRKRVKQSLERTLCSPCPYCEGAGYVKSVQTVIGEILIEAQKIARAIEGKDVLLRVHPDVAKVLKANDNKYLEELEQILSRPVLVKGDPTLHMEKFDLG